MAQKAILRAGLVLALLLWTGTVLAQGLAPRHANPHGQAPGRNETSPSDTWRGQYYDNQSLSGLPVLTRHEERIAYHWGLGSPAAEIPSDNFSVRWTRSVPFQAGHYRFTATSDDGIRVYVDGRPIIDEWHDHSVRSYITEFNVAGGPHEIVVEYYEHTGDASARLEWELLSAGIETWQGEYYDNPQLEGAPVLTRRDENIHYDWEYGSPDARIAHDGFSARWTRTAHLQSGLYRFTTTTDDGVRLWVNNHLLIDQWIDQAARSHSARVYVSGDMPIVMEYYEKEGVASAQLAWTRIGDGPPQSPPPTGAIVVDDGDPGFSKGGAPTAWREAEGGSGGRLTWTWNNDHIRPRYNWARWSVDLEPGCYEVQVYVPAAHATTTQARYWVAHQDGFTLHRVDQSANGGTWVSLGLHRFGGPGKEYVSLADVTYEPYLSTSIAFDAVRWVPR